MENKTQESSLGWKLARRFLIGLAIFVTLIGLFYAEEDLRGRLAWKSYQRQAQEKGVLLTHVDFSTPPVPDDENFAMTPFLAPLLDYTTQPLPPRHSIWTDQAGYERATKFAKDFNTAVGNLKDSHAAQEAPYTDLGDLAHVLQRKSNSGLAIDTRSGAAEEILHDTEKYQPVLGELRAASRRPSSRFNVHYTDLDPTQILLPHLGVLRRVGRVVYYRASAELELRRNDTAYEDLEFLIRMANAIRNEPFMISPLVRVAILDEAQQIAWEGLANHAWSAPQLQLLQTQLEKVTVLSDAQLGVRQEHAEHGFQLFDLQRSNPQLIAEDLNWKPDAARAMRLMPSGWSYLEQVSYNRLYDEYVLELVNTSATRIPAQKIEQAARTLNQIFHVSPATAILRHRVAASVLLSPLTYYYQKVGFCQTMMDEAAIACALERYRLANSDQYPPSLDALSPFYLTSIPHDVITGEPLKYRQADRQFTLYSVGWNEKDDDGQIVFKPTNHARDLSQGDWAWQPYK